MEPDAKLSRAKRKLKPVKNLPDAVKYIDFEDTTGWRAVKNQISPRTVQVALLRAFRARYLISQAEAAKRIGITYRTYWDLEHGLTIMSDETKVKCLESGFFQPMHFGIRAAENNWNEEASWNVLE